MEVWLTNLSLLVTTQFEVFASFQRILFLLLTLGALHSKYYFFSCLSLKWQSWCNHKETISFLPSCERQALSDHHTLFVYGHIVSYLQEIYYDIALKRLKVPRARSENTVKRFSHLARTVWPSPSCIGRP